MKFSDGLWLNQRGFDVSYAVQAYDVTTTKNSIKIFATSSAIWNRAMTLGAQQGDGRFGGGLVFHHDVLCVHTDKAIIPDGNLTCATVNIAVLGFQYRPVIAIGHDLHTGS